MATPRLLFLCHTLPYPPDLGVHIRTYHTLRLLAREFRITLLCFYRREDRPTAAEVETGLAELRKLVDEAHAFPIEQSQSRARYVLDHVRSLVGGRAYTEFVYESQAFRNQLRTFLRSGPFDLIHIDSLDLAPYLSAFQSDSVVCVHHNVESELLRRRAGNEKSALARRYIAYQADRVESLERAWCERFALNIAVSEQDRRSFLELAPAARFLVVPNGVDTMQFAMSEQPQEGVVFVGGTQWFPNRDALVHFCADILPHLRTSGETTSVRWVGRAPEPMIRSYREQYGVDLTGYVPDVRPYIDSAACYIVPLRVGGGTRLKILDAWASGKAVVSTSIGCEGLAARDGVNILIRDDPASFAQAVRDVLSNSELRNRLGRMARETAVSMYDWEVIGKPMVENYHEIINVRLKKHSA